MNPPRLSVECFPFRSPAVARWCPRALAVVVAGGILCASAATARADRVARLIQILKKDESYKVRLQAVLGLGKLKDKRAVNALMTVGLADDAYAVRALAATALGRIGDRSAVSALKRARKTERHSFVRSQLDKALKALEGGVGIAPGARFFVTVGKIGNKSGKGGTELTRALGEALLKEFAKVSGVATGRSGATPDMALLRKRRVKAFVLDGSILSATQRPAGGQVEISCAIKVSLATYPQNSMKAFYSGGASMQVSAQEARSGNSISLFKEVLAGAATGAREQIVNSYLSAQ